MVLTVPLGGGHTAAASAIASALAELAVEVEVIDISAKIFERFPFDKVIRTTYRWFSTWWGGRIHAALYRFADKHPTVTSRLVNLMLGSRVERWLKTAGSVDAFISTFSLVSYVLARRLPRNTGPSVVSFVTDAGRVNSIWFQGDVDRFIVSGSDTSDFAELLGVPLERIAVARPPIATRGRDSRSKAEARSVLGLDDRFTILLTSGGEGLGHGVLEAARSLTRSDLDLQLILNAGNSERLFRRFRDISVDRDCLLVRFTHQFPLLLTACDLVVGKAGWLTINEAMAIRRPTLIVDVLPGQEEANCAFAERRGVARRVRPEDVLELVRGYTSSSSTFSTDFIDGEEKSLGSSWPAELREAVKSIVIARERTYA